MKSLIVFLVLVSKSLYADEKICEEIVSEYRYPLSENDFTKANFDLALSSLRDTDNNDFYDIECNLMNIKGYMYKLHLKSNPSNMLLINSIGVK